MSLDTILQDYRALSKTEREKGGYFEKLCKDFLGNDPRYTSQFSRVQTYAEWASEQGRDQRDLGVDLVATLAGDGGYCAVQCKFYDPEHRMQRAEINSFFTELGKEYFAQGLFIDTTSVAWSANAESAFTEQSKPINRLNLKDLDDSSIDWGRYQTDKTITHRGKKQLRPHQSEALRKVKVGLEKADRGKLIMACGTGKTFTSLKIAEELTGAGASVLFLVPSLALMSQSITDYMLESDTPIRALAVCSDVHVGKRKKSGDDTEIALHDLAYPATTKAYQLARQAKAQKAGEMLVIFATYQSIEVVATAQAEHGMAEFDLIICDEAHRTTGVKLTDEKESHFIKVHDQNSIKGKKRLYMTATPRIYGETVKSKAKEAAATLCSMDNEALYGKTLYRLNFSEAVEQDLLSDYKVVVLAIDQDMVAAAMQAPIFDAESGAMKLDDATKLVGCYRALTKLDPDLQNESDPRPMRKAVAFCNTIENSELFSTHFDLVVEEYVRNTNAEGEHDRLKCETRHIDGTHNASQKNAKISWLKADTNENTCRILSNARCLAEGVDVPALDAIMFLHPRNSMIDVVQSVGRVMRKAPGKSMGYVILPIGLPAGVSSEQALNDSKTYRSVWQVLNALRSHDEQLDAEINKIDLGAKTDKIKVIGIGEGRPHNTNEEDKGKIKPVTPQPKLGTGDLQLAVYAKLVEKCGTRNYWEDWSCDIAKIAEAHISRIGGILKQNADAKGLFDDFLAEIQAQLNNSITADDAIEMLAQHLITKPVFDALFGDYSFAKHNPISQAMQAMLDLLAEQNLESEVETLEKFYESVKMRAKGVENIEGKQKIILELYDKFFRGAFKRTTEKLGIVYTPIAVVDFIIHSLNDLLQTEFGQTLGSEGVHILDPFTGTGTFITRLLQSGLIAPEQLEYKYQNEIHANEIVLLAYYIASINIEQVYRSLSGGEYAPFGGICLSDTFAFDQKGTQSISGTFAENSQRRQRQEDQKIRVIMGNPPYSVGQKSENDNNQNVSYPQLDQSIKTSYVRSSKATLRRALYDNYVRAIRWASDRIGTSGVIGYVTNASFIDSNTADGLRKCLAEEYTSLYVFTLRGNQRTSGETSRQEGGKIFGSGSRTPVAITLLVKNPASAERGRIFYHDIGDYLSRDQKLKIITNFKSIAGIAKNPGWTPITPDADHDWINQRDTSFDAFIPLGDKRDKAAITLFANYSRGVQSNRDAWVYNASLDRLKETVQQTLEVYNQAREAYHALPQGENKPKVADFITNNPRQISWTHDLKDNLKKNKPLAEQESGYVPALYRPFSKVHCYFNRDLNERVCQMPKLFPYQGAENRLICATGLGSKEFSVLMTDTLPDFGCISISQCFPLRLYESKDGYQPNPSIFGEKENEGYSIKDTITPEGLAHFQDFYGDQNINREDLFYYVYGLLHSPEYRAKYANNLTKQLPRVPRVQTLDDFRAFSSIGQALGDLHTGYESAKPYADLILDIAGDTERQLPDGAFRVEKMKFAKVRGKKKLQTDKSSIVYNHQITLSNIPLRAYDYVVNGKPALEWVMERQAIRTDTKSGITSDANAWAQGTKDGARYPLMLLLRMITVSLDTLDLIEKLPKLTEG